MKNALAALCFLLTYLNLCSQNQILEFRNDLKTTSFKVNQTHTVIDEADKTISFFLQDAIDLYCYMFDENFNEIGKLNLPNLDSKFQVFLGSSSNGSEKTIYLSNQNNSKFGFVKFSFENNTNTAKELDINLRKERFIQSVSLKNKFYFLTVTLKESIINVYEFDNDGNYKRHELDFSNKRILGNDNKLITLFKAFSQSDGNTTNYIAKRAQYESPNSIESTSPSTKLYVINDKIILTLDKSQEFTQIITIDTKDFNYEIKTLSKPFINFTGDFKMSNSFIYEDKLLTMVSCVDELAIGIQNIHSGEVINEYSFTKGEEVFFKNTPFIQKNERNNNHNEIYKSNAFLRKIVRTEVGISVYKKDNIYQISVGGIGEVASAATVLVHLVPIPALQFGPLAIGINPITAAFGNFMNTQSTYIICLFDENFEHVQGKPEDNIFDKIADFSRENKKELSAPTVFMIGDKTYFGYYEANIRMFRVLEFTE
jgi:hypothetical protein